ncbi:hypothetical protein [Streptomyces sp. SM13]|uniref:effector-associated constant component EACC1 n=1 Tax=Streptomyces sp. SM13 TaxID=1983803 RepID=UPI000CD5456F|nr:hypothetical protein [Streptomyces sp. SM13]
MRLTVTVQDDAGEGNGHAELRSWLLDVPELRGRVDRRERDDGSARTMGPAADALVALLEPGGVAAAFAGAMVAWVQTRRSSHTVTVIRPDGTEITISSRQARAMSPEEAAALAERLARPPEHGAPPAVPPGSADTPDEPRRGGDTTDDPRRDPDASG